MIATAIGLVAAVAANLMPHPIRLGGVELGDIGLPLAGIKQFEHGGSPYDVRLGGSTPALYPFTAMVVLWPFSLLPASVVVPLFIGVSSALLAFAIARKGDLWQLLIFLSPSYWSAVYSVQWSSVLTAAILLPPLLPLAVVKPQLGLVLAASGKWSIRTVAASVGILGISLLLWPAWPIAWLKHGNLGTFNGYSPVMVFPGVFLLLSVLAIRERSGRLLLAASLVVQRYFYDQLPLYLIPKTWRQMVFLLLTSWTMVGGMLFYRWADLRSGDQSKGVWTLVIIAVFLPALGVLLYNSRRRAATPASLTFTSP